MGVWPDDPDMAGKSTSICAVCRGGAQPPGEFSAETQRARRIKKIIHRKGAKDAKNTKYIINHCCPINIDRIICKVMYGKTIPATATYGT
jgi:hypothetical protein